MGWDGTRAPLSSRTALMQSSCSALDAFGPQARMQFMAVCPVGRVADATVRGMAEWDGMEGKGGTEADVIESNRIGSDRTGLGGSPFLLTAAALCNHAHLRAAALLAVLEGRLRLAGAVWTCETFPNTRANTYKSACQAQLSIHRQCNLHV